MTPKAAPTEAAEAAAATPTEGNNGQPLRLLGRDEILGIEDRQYKTFPVRAWGGRLVRIQSLTAKEREEFEQSISTTGNDGVARTNLIGARAKLVVRTLVNENGGKIFDDSFVGALANKSADAIGQIFEEASKLSGIMKRDVEELVGNSSDGRTDSSSSP